MEMIESKENLKEEFIKNNKRKLIKRKGMKCCKSFINCICPWCKKINLSEDRFVDFNDVNMTEFSNKLENNKYNIFTFLPLVLFHQFKFFSNQFYLLMVISQFFDALKVGFLFSYVAPLMFVLIVTLTKEALDDLFRYRQDKITNNQMFTKITSLGKVQIKSQDIKIGDLILLNQNERIPADMLVVHTSDESGSLFIRTDQLDGETDWKLRKAPSLTQKLNIEQLCDIEGYIQIDPPNKMIYEFKGIMKLFDHNYDPKTESLSLENTMWASTVLASKKVIGLVIYTGIETRAKMNSSRPKSKVGKLDLELNLLNKILFAIMLISAIIITGMKGFTSSFYMTIINFFRFVVLLCAIIPISLAVNLDISKTVNSQIISQDKNIPETIVRNSTIPEDLGRIDYVFSDKTGTLTKNEMIFKQIAMENDVFNEESFDNLQQIVQHECSKSDAPLLDLIGKDEINFNKRIRRNRDKVVRDLITAMTLCNNVTPIFEDNEVTYQASSPDEVALVKIANRLNMRLIGRTEKTITLKNANDKIEEYEILANFPFSSETKRMGILVRNLAHGHIIFYLKGAENIILKFVKDEYSGFIKENAENLACIGLRTLVLTQKIISNEFYTNWIKEYNEALTSMGDRKKLVQDVISKLENNMDFLGVTGVEDLLQDEVKDTIESLRNAGIKIWMLTGDKVETATCIAISTGIKNKKQNFFVIRDKASEPEYVRKQLEDFEHINDSVLIIDGDCLEVALNNHESLFFQTSMKAPSVVCCRCSPTQKSRIVKTIKKYTDKRTCAIGDGGNDVAMIQEADVGIGIVGKEGLQASLAADYSIIKFKHLNLLLLWFGRISYKNTATIAKFVIHRGLIISLIQFIFSIIFYCSSVAIYNGMLILGYSTIYTSLPVITLLLDRDTDMRNVMKFPILYKKLLKGRELSIKAFLWWFWKSIFQASIIMLGALLIFDNLFLKIATITFTALIFAELLNVYSEIKTFHRYMTLSLVGTLFTYLFSLIFLKSILDVYYIFDILTISKILALAIVSWLPFYLYYQLRAKCFPEAHEKLEVVEESEN